MNDIDETLTALADPIRRHVVELLQQGPQRASSIAELAGMSPAAMSRHLRVLRRSGLVDVESPEDDARVRVYRLQAEGLVALTAWLDQVQAFWAEQLDSFEEHTERTRGAAR
jgi:DNA-binding transcriptional ArsR family regulator